MTRDQVGNTHPPEDDGLTQLDDGDILALVHAGARRFDRQIKHRDWRELIASAVVVVAIAPATVQGPLLARVGACIVLGGLALIALQLWRARRFGGGGADMTLPVAATLRAERQRVNAQIALLEGVAWWYVAPLTVGSVLLVAGRGGRGAWSLTLGYVIVVALIGWWIIALNRRAVLRHLRPRLDELSALLAQLES